MKTTIKGILINPKDKTVTKVELQKNANGSCIADIYRLIGCSTFACPVEFPNGDSLYCDDEGLLKNELEGCFMFSDWNTPIVGNALILGTDDDGYSVNAKTSIPTVLENIIWGNKEVAEEYRDFALSQPITIVTDFE